jgi:uncharacterized membrane protein
MTGGLWQLGLAVAVFLASHSLLTRPAWRRPAEAALGRTGFTLAYSLLSLLLLAWVVAAAMAAPVVVVWKQAEWMRWLPPLAMPWACLLGFAGMTTPNPFSIGPGSIGPGGRGFDPAKPGILRLTRHPVLAALALWAGAHILPNGHLAALLLFVPLLALAVAGPRMLDAKRRRSLGPEEWQRLAAATAARPLDWPALLREVGWWRLAGGLALYALLIALHPLVIGVSPLP